MMQRACLFAAMLSAMVMAADATGPAKGDQDMMFHAVKVNKVLFLGNSITNHGPNAKIGWNCHWGMAASAKEKDFVHLILQAFAKAAGKQPEPLISNISTFERKYETYDLDAGLKREFAFKADLVIIAIGENVPNPATAVAKTALQTGVDKLLRKLKENGNPVIVVRSSFWRTPPRTRFWRRRAPRWAASSSMTVPSARMRRTTPARNATSRTRAWPPIPVTKA